MIAINHIPTSAERHVFASQLIARSNQESAEGEILTRYVTLCCIPWTKSLKRRSQDPSIQPVQTYNCNKVRPSLFHCLNIWLLFGFCAMEHQTGGSTELCKRVEHEFQVIFNGKEKKANVTQVQSRRILKQSPHKKQKRKKSHYAERN